MDDLFKRGKFTIVIPVQGETDNYEVKIITTGFLEELHKQMAISKNFDLKTVTKTLTSCFDRDDVFIYCTCPDTKYRFQYWSTQNKYNSGPPQNSNGKRIRNPNDTLGSTCKHGLLVLSNNSWILPCGRVIVNYVEWMKQHKEQMYAEQIYPAIYEQDYEDAMQYDMLAKDELAKGAGDDDEIKAGNIHKGRDAQGRFTSDQEPGQFRKNNQNNKPQNNQQSNQQNDNQEENPQ